MQTSPTDFSAVILRAFVVLCIASSMCFIVACDDDESPSNNNDNNDGNTDPQESTWTLYPAEGTALATSMLLSVTIGNDGTVWIGSWDRGILSFDGENFTRIEDINNPFSFKRILDIVSAADGTIWFAGENGIGSVKDDSWEYFSDFPETGGLFEGTALHIQTSDGTLWVGTQSKGVVTMRNGVWGERYHTGNGALPFDEVNSINEDGQGNIWVATERGAAMFNGQEWTHFTKEDRQLPGTTVYTLAPHPDGSMWLGFPSNHLARYANGEFSIFDDETSGMPSNEVRSLYIDDQSRLWAGMSMNPSQFKGGFGRFENGVWTYYTMSNSEINTHSITDITMDANGILWLVSFETGLLRLNPSLLN